MGCQKCNAMKNEENQNKGLTTKEKTCKTCKNNFVKFAPTLAFSLIFFSFAVYGVVTFVKDMIELFSK
jgi:hypothetical protein